MLKGKLKVIEIKNIDFGKRARINYKDIHALAQNIETNGLIHPIAICHHPEIKKDNTFLLLAGGRRLRAHQLLDTESIECKVFDGELTPLQIKTIELMENMHREDLEYVEKVKLQQEIYNFHVQIYGKKTSTLPNAPGVSVRNVADMLGVSNTKLCEDLNLAKAIDNLPEVDWKKLKNRSDAIKTKKSIEKTIVNQALSEQVEKEIGNSNDVVKQKLISYYIIGDFFEKVQELPANSFGFCEIDPPYSINIAKQKRKDYFNPYIYGPGGYNGIPAEEYPNFMRNTFRECYRVMQSNSFLVCWFGPDPWFQQIYEWLIEAGFNTRRLVGHWIKGEDKEGDSMIEQTAGQTNNPSTHLANASENFYYAWKGKPELNRPGMTNVFGHKPVPPTRKIHPTERPQALIDDILTTFCAPGTRVLVPFAGSGKTLISAFLNKMIPLGFDLTDIYREGYIIKINELFLNEEKA